MWFLAGMWAAREDSMKVVRFNAQGVATSSSYLDAGHGVLPTLKQVSLLIRAILPLRKIVLYVM